MVNDFRTLLANLPPTSSFGPGEVFVPSEYRPRKLDHVEQTIRRAIFGFDPDRLMVNYRCFQLMKLVHASRVRDAVTEVDARLTYDPWVWPGPQQDWLNCRIIAAPTSVMITGMVTPSDAEGKAIDRYSLQVTDSNTVAVTRFADFIRNIDFTMTGGISSDIPLGSSGLTLRFSGDPVVDATYVIEIPREPARSLGEIEVAISDLVDYGTISSLLNAGTGMQRITSNSLWYRSRDTQLRLAGMTIAMVNYARSRS